MLAGRAADNGVRSSSAVRRRLAELYAAERAVDLLNRLHKEETAAGVVLGNRGSVAKMAATDQMNFGVQVAFEVGGVDLATGGPAATTENSLLNDILETRSSGIAGGSDEIQRNIIGERVLGLPSEPRVDKNLPFSELKIGTQAR